MSEGEVWFRYERTPIRLRATPVHWKGWAYLIAGPLLLVALSLGGAALLPDGPPRVIWHFSSLLVGLPLFFVLTFKLVIAKGRPV